jgi:hypothetical protein
MEVDNRRDLGDARLRMCQRLNEAHRRWLEGMGTGGYVRGRARRGGWQRQWVMGDGKPPSILGTRPPWNWMLGLTYSVSRTLSDCLPARTSLIHPSQAHVEQKHISKAHPARPVLGTSPFRPARSPGTPFDGNLSLCHSPGSRTRDRPRHGFPGAQPGSVHDDDPHKPPTTVDTHRHSLA